MERMACLIHLCLQDEAALLAGGATGFSRELQSLRGRSEFLSITAIFIPSCDRLFSRRLLCITLQGL